MPLLDLQRRYVELGRIRIGVQVTKGGKTRPEKLETFRLTTAARARADAVAEVFGGEVKPWSPDGTAQQFEVITPLAEIPVIVPPGQAVTAWWELWSGGGCQRRCNGEANVLTGEACQCPSDLGVRSAMATEGKACKPTTRVNVMLADLPGLGVWRLESHGYNAATELVGTAEFLETAAMSGRSLPATLRLEQRSVKREGQTRRYAVPVLDVGETPARLLAGASSRSPVAAITSGAPEEGLAVRIAVVGTLEGLRALWVEASAAGLLSRVVVDALDGRPLRVDELFDRRRAELTP
jgi:hypothetical protein